jgi:hypothetical protein
VHVPCGNTIPWGQRSVTRLGVAFMHALKHSSITGLAFSMPIIGTRQRGPRRVNSRLPLPDATCNPLHLPSIGTAAPARLQPSTSTLAHSRSSLKILLENRKLSCIFQTAGHHGTVCNSVQRRRLHDVGGAQRRCNAATAPIPELIGRTATRASIRESGRAKRR